ncbi:MAG: ParB/RepB/Spo0J family partition protein [Candidatus Spyradocola sp.]
MRERATANDVPFTPLDKLFEPTVPQGPELPAVDTLPVEALRPFSGHPFHLYTDEKLRELTDSIREHGVLMPVLVRPVDGGYEIVSGHNRVEAAKLAGLDKVPVTVRELDDDTATILMVDSNLRQRETLLPSEKAWAYRMKFEAMRRQTGRRGKNVSQVGTQKRTDQIIAEEVGESRNQIARYIRLTELIPPFLDMVDNGRLAFNPAVELSYLSLENQTILFSIMERDELSPSLAQAQNLHKLSSLGKLDESAIEAILLTEPVLKKKVTLKVERIAPYFPRGTNPEEMEAVILRLLASWQRSREQKRAHESGDR